MLDRTRGESPSKVNNAGPRSIGDLRVPCHMFACSVACTAIVFVFLFFSHYIAFCDSSDNCCVVNGREDGANSMFTAVL